MGKRFDLKPASEQFAKDVQHGKHPATAAGGMNHGDYQLSRFTICLFKSLLEQLEREFDALDERLKPAVPATIVSVDLQEDPDDDRTMLRTETWSDGQKFVGRLRNDGPLFRGTYERGAKYAQGDWIVWGGSTWACTKDTLEMPGSHSLAWKIAAHKGRDGQR